MLADYHLETSNDSPSLGDLFRLSVFLVKGLQLKGADMNLEASRLKQGLLAVVTQPASPLHRTVRLNMPSSSSLVPNQAWISQEFYTLTLYCCYFLVTVIITQFFLAILRLQ